MNLTEKYTHFEASTRITLIFSNNSERLIWWSESDQPTLWLAQVGLPSFWAQFRLSNPIALSISISLIIQKAKEFSNIDTGQIDEDVSGKETDILLGCEHGAHTTIENLSQERACNLFLWYESKLERVIQLLYCTGRGKQRREGKKKTS